MARTVMGKAQVFQHTAARRRLLNGQRRITSLYWFQHTAARRRLPEAELNNRLYQTFQHTAARRRLPFSLSYKNFPNWFQHTAARRRLPIYSDYKLNKIVVSTHSRAEAAAFLARFFNYRHRVSTHSRAEAAALDLLDFWRWLKFQHTAARRRLLLSTTNKWRSNNGFNTQPRGGGCLLHQL